MSESNATVAVYVAVVDENAMPLWPSLIFMDQTPWEKIGDMARAFKRMPWRLGEHVYEVTEGRMYLSPHHIPEELNPGAIIAATEYVTLVWQLTMRKVT